jgi:transposase
MPTCFEIYETYQRGPAAVLRLFEEALGTRAIYGPPDPDTQQRTIDSLSEEIGRLKRQVFRLKAALGKVRGEVDWLRRRNAELEKLVTKDSHNSSRPPSSDPPWAKRTKSLRRPSGQRPGGQPGHASHTLRLTRTPQRVVIHRPAWCRHCSESLAGARGMSVERRQVVELMPARLRVTEHRAEVVCCSSCGRRTKASFPAGVSATVQYGPSIMARALYLHGYQLLPYARAAEAMGELFGCAMSVGTLATAVRRCAAELIETELKIKHGLRRSAVIHADETGLRVNQKLAYVHVASSERLTHYAADVRRGKAAIDEIDILPSYRGTCVHDGWLSYTHYSGCRHALCGAHLLRELTYFEELSGVTKAWAAPLKELLLEMKGVAEREGAHVPAWRVEELRARYDRRVAEGQEPQPSPDVPPSAWRQARNLLRRLGRRKGEVLRFLSDPSVPFDRNERRSQRQRSTVPPNSAFASVGLVRHAGWRPTRLGSRLRSRALDRASGTLVEHAVPWLALR